MHLISLAIHGFKSFPERTILEFHEGVTAIVGPNGSGKSNVTDAIRWVLGEQSVKTLRGDSMQDIIFSGTSTRRSMSFAEVTMNVDNSDGLLKIDFAEVSITRRLYRSGESEYLINQQQVRLKDINHLFMDTGLGKDSYSIIGQGKVDEILSTKSEDRRRVFEEAAGIQKYKTRRVDATRRLEHTEANLTRVNDILAELEGQLEPLRKQSETAKSYLNLHARMRELDIALLNHQIKTAKDKYDEIDTDLNLTRADLADSRQRQEALDLQQLSGRETLALLSDTLKSLRDERNQLTSEETLAKQEETRLLERREQLERRLGEQGESAGQIDSHLKTLESDLRARETAMKGVEGELEDAEADFAYLRHTLRERQDMVRAIETKLQSLQQAEQRITAEKIRLQGLKLRQDNEAELLRQQAVDLKEEINELDRQKDEIEARLEDCRKTMVSIRENDEQLAVQSRELSGRIALQRDELKDAEARGQSVAQEIRNKTYRLDTLRELERNMEGYAEPVRNILRRAEGDDRLRGSVRGALGSLLKVEASYEMAIEIALGASVQNIVVDTSRVAGSMIDLLKRERLGRATFLPIDTIRPRYLGDHELRELESLRRRGFIGIASDLVSYATDLDGIMKNLLGRIVIVDNLDNALIIAKQFKQNFRLVTLEGDVLNPGGSMTGGYTKKKSSGLLGRGRDITRLEEEINELWRSAKTAEAESKAQEQNLREIIREQEKLQAKGMEMAQLKSREEARESALGEQQESLAKRRIQKHKQADELAARALRTQSGNSEIDSLMDALATNIREIAQEILVTDTALSEHSQLQSEARDALAEADLTRTRLEESLRSAREVCSHVKREFDGRAREAKDAAMLRERATVEIERLKNQLGEISVKVSTAREALGRQDELILGAEQARLEQDNVINRLYVEMREQTETTMALQTQLERLEARSEKLNQDLDDARSRLWEDYELTTQMLLKDESEAEEADDLDVSASTKEIASLRSKIRALGPVNVDAIEDYDKVGERYHFLCAQRDDIDAAREQLNKVIIELVAAMRDQFQTNFELIRVYFQETFQELFGGGEADIQFEEGQDILDSSIEIKASPPGKKLQNMLLLSGGERSLTAIALLFAILKLRPTPFCVLDEIEAALDDVNTLRFTDYIRSYKEKSQFIMVTHRKGTMESADMIYGVTMQEKGVSKVLSMVLSDAN